MKNICERCGKEFYTNDPAEDKFANYCNDCIEALAEGAK